MPSSASAAGSRTGTVPPRGTVKRVIVSAPYGRQTAGVGPLVIEMLRPAEVLAQFDAAAGPAGQIDGEALDRAERALAPAQCDRVGHVGAQRARVALEVRRAEQVGEVGDDPVVAGVDEQIVVELRDVGVQRAERGLDRREVGAQLVRRRLFRVADAVDLGQPVEQRHKRCGHTHSPAEGSAAEISVRCAGASCSSSCAEQGSVASSGRGDAGNTQRRHIGDARRQTGREP